MGALGLGDRGFRREERLRRNAEFQRVYRNGRSYATPLLVLFLYSSPDLERRVGVVAGRKVGNAIRRNRAKRLLREAYRHHKHRLPEQGVQAVLVARRSCADASFAEVERDLVSLWDRLDLTSKEDAEKGGLGDGA